MVSLIQKGKERVLGAWQEEEPLTAGQGGEIGARSHGKLEGARPSEPYPHAVLSLSLNKPQTQTQALGVPQGPTTAAAMAAATRKHRHRGHLGFGTNRLSSLGFPCFSPLQRGCESREEPWHLPVRGLVQQKEGARVETPCNEKTQHQQNWKETCC